MINSINTNSDLLIKLLEKVNINTAFGVAGGFIEPFLNAMAKAQRKGMFSIIPTKHESAAAMMADGYYRIKKVPALCFSTAGPGITNMLTGVSCAYQDQIPMILITPLNSSENHGRGALQDSSISGVNVHQMLGACTVYNEIITHPAQIVNKFYAAYIKSMYGSRKGPVNLSIPVELLREKSSDTSFDLPYNNHSDLQKVNSNELTFILNQLSSSLKSTFVYGEQMEGRELLKFLSLANHFNASIVEVPMSKGSIPPNTSNFKGVYGFAGHESATDAINQSDSIISFGVDITEISTKTWSNEFLSKKTIFLTDSLLTITKSQGVRKSILLNVDQFILDLFNELKVDLIKLSSDKTDLQMFKSNSEEIIKPSELVSQLSNLVPENTNVFFDSGNSFVWGTHYWNARRSKSYFKKLCHMGFGFASMGWAISSSIGGALASGELTVCVTGDGSYLMSSQELVTAKEQNLNILFIILNDSGYGMVKHGQKLSGAEKVCHELPNIDYTLIAQAYKVESYIVNTLNELRNLPLNKIYKSSGPVLIDARIDLEEVPPMGDRMKALGSV